MRPSRPDGTPTCTPGLGWVSMETALALLAGFAGRDLLDPPASQ